MIPLYCTRPATCDELDAHGFEGQTKHATFVDCLIERQEREAPQAQQHNWRLCRLAEEKTLNGRYCSKRSSSEGTVQNEMSDTLQTRFAMCFTTLLIYEHFPHNDSVPACVRL